MRPPLVVGVVKRDATPKRRMNILGSPLVSSLQIVKFPHFEFSTP